MEMMSNCRYLSVDDFIRTIGFVDPEMVNTVLNFSQNSDHPINWSRVIALALIIDLYGTDSTDTANVSRITLNLEVVSDELNRVSHSIKSLLLTL